MDKQVHGLLLIIDAVINLLLGVGLLLAPLGTVSLLGLPDTGSYFYSTILGAVLVGIAIALVLSSRSMAGLGLSGAIAINICGATAVIVWLITSPGVLSPLGSGVLWLVALIVLGIGVAELVSKL